MSDPQPPEEKFHRTSKYVNNYLQNEGLKCLTDGKQHYLDPPVGLGDLSLPTLTGLGKAVHVFFFDVVSPRYEEWGGGSAEEEVDKEVEEEEEEGEGGRAAEEEGGKVAEEEGKDGGGSAEKIKDSESIDIAYIYEYTSNNPANSYEYSQLFLGRMWEIYPKRRTLIVSWETSTAPVDEKVASPAPPLGQAGEGYAYYAEQPQIFQGSVEKVHQTSVEESNEEVLSSTAALEHLHVTKQFQHVFEGHHQLLTVGSQTFLCTNLSQLIDGCLPPLYSDEERSFKMDPKPRIKK